MEPKFSRGPFSPKMLGKILGLPYIRPRVQLIKLWRNQQCVSNLTPQFAWNPWERYSPPLNLDVTHKRIQKMHIRLTKNESLYRERFQPG